MAKKKQPASEVKHWLGEITSAKKREKDFRKDGREIVEIYSGKKKDTVPFNILFSNTETLLPALFSQVPRPVVQRRFKDEDPIGKAAAHAAQRMLEFLCDTNVEGYETYEQSMKSATLDGLLPGRGVTSIKYDASIIDGEIPVVDWEQVCTDTRAWERVYFGYAKKWSDVPWIAYEEYLDEKECKNLFGDDVTKNITFTTGEEDEDEEDGGTRTHKEEDQGERKTACIYQIWDRHGGKLVKYISPGYTDGFLLVEEDQLKITGFFNCPKPIQFVEKSNDLIPTAMYKLYENQARELNRITLRLKNVIEAIKVRGAYDGSLGNELEQIFAGDDNTLVPAETGSALSLEKGFDNAIWMIPIDKLIIVARELFQAREQTKRVIYEITGVSDIIRGQSVASETLGAQKIKESWGTMRLKRLQKEVQRYARDVLRMMLEVAAQKFSEETWAKATGLPFNTTEQKSQLEMQLQTMQMQGMQMQQSGMQPNQQQMQEFQRVQSELQKPFWGQILELLKNDVQRAYRIDIETNSTIDVEATEDQKLVGDFMNAFGQMMSGLTPMVESGAMDFEVAKTMMLAVVRKFRFGVEVEDQLKSMKAPQPKDNGEAAKIQAEAQAKQAELQADMQLNAAKVKAERETAQMEANIKRDTELKVATIQQQTEVEKAQIQAKAQIMAAKVSASMGEGVDIESLSTVGEFRDSVSQSIQAMNEAQLMALQTIAESLNKPKRVIRGPDGRVAGVE